MSRTSVRPSVFGLAALACLIASCLALAAPPADLPQLPPPGKLPVPPPGKVPALQPPPAPVPVTLIPVELTVSLADLKKQMIRGIALKANPNADPKVEPVLPLIVKTNDPRLAPPPALPAKAPEVRPVEGQLPVPLPAAKPVPQPLPQPVPVPDVREVPEPGPPAGRPRLFNRRPQDPRPLLERIAERPVVQNAVERIVEGGDMIYVVDIQSLDVAVTGNTLTCEVAAGFHSDSKSQPGSVREVTFRVRVTKDLVWSEAGKLELKEGASKVWIDPTAPLVGFPRLDVARVIQLNALLDLVGGAVDRELMKRLPAENLPDLSKLGPQINGKVPFLALAEVTAYPLRGDEKNLFVSLVLGFVPANKKVGDDVKVASKTGAAPEPKFKGQIQFDAAGKPDVKLEPVR
ncbi:hypothetical protein [Gemmata sp.]|uniref:hypothetical protein n=1 Tax=Gemmata sp. TaxID=1914242 RepID=UPI003F71B230